MRSPSDYIIFPLDVASREEAKELVGLLAGQVGMFKIGLELFIRSGPDLIAWIRSEYGTSVFLDLKLHDIPATVERAIEEEDIAPYLAALEPLLERHDGAEVAAAALALLRKHRPSAAGGPSASPAPRTAHSDRPIGRKRSSSIVTSGGCASQSITVTGSGSIRNSS